MQTSGGNTTKRRARTIAVAAFPIAAFLLPLAAGGGATADPISDTVCTVRGLLNVLTEPCAQASPQPQPSAAPTAAPSARPSTRASASPAAPSKARTPTSSGARAPAQAGTIPPSQPEQPAPSGPDAGVVQPIVQPAIDQTAGTRPVAWPFTIADAIFAASMSGGLVWLLAVRRRRRVQDEAAAATRRVERMKDEIVSNLSHELFTPLTPVIGYATMLRNGQIPPAQTRKIAEKLIGASEQLERTIDLLVTYAAVRGGSMKPSCSPLDLPAVVDNVAAAHRARTPGRSIVVTVSGSLPSVTGDARLLHGAIDQLVDNAIKFSPAGGQVTIALHSGPPESNAVEIVVSDQGVGISPADLPHIFDDFRQVDGSSTRHFGGVGLGLALASSVAEMHGGSVVAESRPGEGSAFTIRIAAVAAARPVPVHARLRNRLSHTSAA